MRATLWPRWEKGRVRIWGFDISKEMVKKSKTMSAGGFNPDQIFWGDIQDPISYAYALKDGPFDGLMAMGVMPHVENDDLVLENMSNPYPSRRQCFHRVS